MPPRFEASVRTERDATIIDLHGEIDSFAEDALQAAYADAERRGSGRIILNFTDVSYINSTGIALVVGLLARARKTHRDLSAFGLSPHYIEIFQITRLVDFMQIAPNEASALSTES